MTIYEICKNNKTTCLMYVIIICGDKERFTNRQAILDNPKDKLYSRKVRYSKCEFLPWADKGHGAWELTLRLVDCPKNRAAFDF